MSKIERSIINLTAPVELKASQDPGGRRFEVLAYTGKVVRTWFGDFMIDVSGMQMKEKIPILREHERDRIVGWSDGAKKENGALSVSGSFSNSTPDGKEVLALADEGFPWQASVGIKPLQAKILKNADEKATVNGREVSGPLEIWSKTLVGEVSMVSWGADNDTSMQLLSEGEKVSVDIEGLELTEDKTMTIEELKEKHPEIHRAVFEAGASSVDLSASRNDGKAEGAKEERERVSAILSVDGADAEAKHKAIMEGLSMDAAYKLFFESELGKKKSGLEELRGQAPGSIGHQTPKEPEELSGDPAKIVSDKAIALSRSEKIGLDEATQRILAENKELAAKYYGQFEA